MRKLKLIFPLIGLISIFSSIVVAVTQLHAAPNLKYETEQSWSPGTVVSLDASQQLVPGSTSTPNYIGVTNPQTAQGYADITNSGEALVLVTDRYGTIKQGSRIGLSDLPGIAGTYKSGIVIGTIKDTPKESDWVPVIVDGVSVRVATLSAIIEGSAVSSQNNFLGSTAQLVTTLTGKQVEAWRILVALIIGGGGLLFSLTLLITTSRQSFLSLGRNPFASKLIYKGLWKMVGVCAAILMGCLITAYAVLVIGSA